MARRRPKVLVPVHVWVWTCWQGYDAKLLVRHGSVKQKPAMRGSSMTTRSKFMIEPQPSA